MRFSVSAGVALAVSLVVLAGSAFGQDDPIAARQKLMKMNNASSRTAFQMISGKTPYDPVAAAAAMTEIADDMKQFVTLFPEGSTGGDSEASPDIWTHMDDFTALATKLQTDATAAAAAAPNGLDAFKTAFNAVGGDCMACHQKYRLSQ
jgi:cytochrome c556